MQITRQFVTQLINWKSFYSSNALKANYSGVEINVVEYAH